MQLVKFCGLIQHSQTFVNVALICQGQAILYNYQTLKSKDN